MHRAVRPLRVAARRRHFSTVGPAGSTQGQPGGEPEVEKLGFVRATGGLVLASAGAILVFGVGVMGVLGTAKAVGSILGHSLESKRDETSK